MTAGLNYSALFESLAGRGFTAQEIVTAIGKLGLEGAAEAFEYLLARKAPLRRGQFVDELVPELEDASRQRGQTTGRVLRPQVNHFGDGALELLRDPDRPRRAGVRELASDGLERGQVLHFREERLARLPAERDGAEGRAHVHSVEALRHRGEG